MSNKYKVQELVTNLPDVADNHDPRLIIPGGMAVSKDHTMWIANYGDDVSARCITHYDLYGVQLSQPVPFIIYDSPVPLVPASEQRRLLSDLFWLQKNVLFYRDGLYMSMPKFLNFPPIVGSKGKQPSNEQISLSSFLCGNPPNYANGYLGSGVNIYYLINYCIWNPLPLASPAGKQASIILRNAHQNIYRRLILDLFSKDLIFQYGTELTRAQLLISIAQPATSTTATSTPVVSAPKSRFEPVITTFNHKLPIGICYNQSRGFVGFEFNGARVSCDLIAAASDGIIYIYSPLIHVGDNYGALSVIDNSPNYAVYTGITTTQDRIFLTDFANRRIDIYTYGWDSDPDINEKFIDPTLPSDYTPFNIMARKNKIYVLYGKIEPKSDVISNQVAIGPGLGIINEFTYEGNFVRRVVSGGHLNAPWGITKTKKWFANGKFLIGNYGDGCVLVYDKNWNFTGKLKFTDYPSNIASLYSIETIHESVYFTSGPNGIVRGLVGQIKKRCNCKCGHHKGCKCRHNRHKSYENPQIETSPQINEQSDFNVSSDDSLVQSLVRPKYHQKRNLLDYIN